MRALDRLRKSGYELPEPPPRHQFVPVAVVGDLAFVSGMRHIVMAVSVSKAKSGANWIFPQPNRRQGWLSWDACGVCTTASKPWAP
jgi:hypothetical protein